MQLNVTVPMGTQIADIQIAGRNSYTHQLMYLKTGEKSGGTVIISECSHNLSIWCLPKKLFASPPVRKAGEMY